MLILESRSGIPGNPEKYIHIGIFMSVTFVFTHTTKMFFEDHHHSFHIVLVFFNVYFSLIYCTFFYMMPLGRVREAWRVMEPSPALPERSGDRRHHGGCVRTVFDRQLASPRPSDADRDRCLHCFSIIFIDFH